MTDPNPCPHYPLTLPNPNPGEPIEVILGQPVTIALGIRDKARIPSHRHPSHDQYLLLPDADGSILGWVDNFGEKQEEEAAGRKLWIVPQGIEHYLSWSKRGTIIALYVDRNSATEMKTPPIAIPQLCDLNHLENLEPALRHSVRSLQQLCLHRRRGFETYAKAEGTVAVMNIMHVLWDRFPEPIVKRHGLSESIVDRIVDYIDTNLAENLGPRNLREKAAMSRTHFNRLFKKTFTFAPMDFIMRRRVAKASEDLVFTNKKECDIAADCGFSDQGHMARVFQRVLSKNPKDVRNEGRQ